MINLAFSFFSTEYPDDRPDILRGGDAWFGPEGGQDVLHGVRLVPALRGGQATSHSHRVLVQVQFGSRHFFRNFISGFSDNMESFLIKCIFT